MWNHWVARTVTPEAPFKDFNTARWAWFRLAELFPDLIAAVLMPNHLHLIVPKSSQNLKKLHRLLSAISHRCKRECLWQKIPQPTEIPDLSHLNRQIRYVALNPCRKGLCRDPLEWYWSTYREVIGASVTVTAGRAHRRPRVRLKTKHERAKSLAALLKDHRAQFSVRFHAYVSGDPSVNVSGTPFPRAQLPSVFAEKSIREILQASAASLRVLTSEVEIHGSPLRTLFVQMAYRHGWSNPRLLAEICQIKRDAIYYILKKQCQADEIAAADLCLGDARLQTVRHPEAGE